MRQRRPQRGFSLIEMLIVIIIIGVAVGMVVLGFGATAQAKLRSSCWILAAASRYAYSRAVTQGMTTRLVIDFDSHTIRIEETSGRVVLNREDESGTGLRRGEEEYLDGDGGVGNATLSTNLDMIGQDIGGIGGGMGDLGAAAASGDPLSAMMGLGSASAGTGDVQDPLSMMMSGVGMGALSDPFLASMSSGNAARALRYRGARFKPLSGRRGEPRELEGSSVFWRVHTPHEPLPREDGKAYVYYFPGGVTEHSIIQLSDGDERIYSIEIHPLSGRAEVYPFEIEPEEELDDLQEADE